MCATCLEVSWTGRINSDGSDKSLKWTFFPEDYICSARKKVLEATALLVTGRAFFMNIGIDALAF